MDERRDRRGDARDRRGDAREHMDPEGELPDEDHMDERRQRMADARDRRGDARDRRGDAREHMDPEGELPDEDHMDERRQRMADARDRRGDARDRRGDAREHMDPEGELPDEDHMDERRQRMGDARDRMGNARDRMGDARQHMGNARDRMEEEGREHMEDMMMDAFRKDAHPDLARLPNAPICSDTLRERELSPREEGAGCNDHEGDLMFRTICNMPGFGAAAISLPAGRAASCFGLEALRGSIGFEILTEDGHTVWDLSMGPESYEHLELDEGIYHIKATSGDHGGAITISFVDVSVDR